MGSIVDFLTGKTFFITGATGFLGQPLVEKILWAVPDVRRIYVLIRPKRQGGGRILSPQARLQKELFNSSVFDRLRGLLGGRFEEFLAEKLVAVSGDIGGDNLGLEPEVFERLREEVDVVINSAAVVSFDAPLDEALSLNVLGAERVAEFASRCRRAVLVHVSTAYVCGATEGKVPETPYHSVLPDAGGKDPFPPRQFRDVDLELERIREVISRVSGESRSPELDREFKQALVRRSRRPRRTRSGRRRERIESLRKKWLRNRLTREGMAWARRRGWNDTYTYTKALGEQMVLRARGGKATVILRPSVIESSLSEPSPGWLDGLRMADPLIVAIGKGRLRSLPLDPGVALDLVPVDMVVNALLASLPRTAAEGGVRIYQVATADRNPIRLEELNELIYRYFLRNPMLDKQGNPIRIKPLKFPNPATFRFKHRLKAVPLDTAHRTLEKLPAFEATQRFRRRLSAARAAHALLYYYGEIYQPYLNLDCRFQVDNTLRLFQSLCAEDRQRFNFEVSALNWRHYIQNVHIPGVKKYILKVEGAGTLELGASGRPDLEQIATINDLLARGAALYPDKTALQIKRAGQWERVTYGDLRRRAGEIGRRLHSYGFGKGDRLVLYSENQPEWGVSYLGAVSIGLAVVPLDPQTWIKEVWSVSDFAGARAILASESCFKRFTAEGLEKNERSRDPVRLLNVNDDCRPFLLPEYPRSTFSGESVQEVPPQEFEPAEVREDDIASIIFTTGTAVDPRGAMHTHRNFLNNLKGVNVYLPARETDHLLSVLPLYHALEFTCGFLLPMLGGASITYVRSLKPRVILETMRETETTCMLGVPTLYGLIRDDVERRILGARKSVFKSNWMATSKQLTRSVARAFGTNIGRKLFSSVHQEFGGKIRVFVSGGSALGKELYDDFMAMGMPIYEGYGLTETAPVLTVNPLNRSRRNSAGKPLPGVELRIFRPDRDGIGEIIVQTPSLMTGYYKNQAATAKVIQNSWLHTGDLGWVDEGGYLYITGRIKDVIVTGAGKNVYPADLEAIYKSIPCIAEICILGIRSGLTEDVHAVIYPNREALQGVEEGQVKKVLQREIQKVAVQLPSYQRLQYTHIWDLPLPRGKEGSVCRDAVRRKLLEQLGMESRPGVAAPREEHRQPELYRELSRLSGMPVEEIAPETQLYGDLGLDSLNAIELLLFIEHHFGVAIPDERAEQIQTVGQLLEELLTQPSAETAPVRARRRAAAHSALPYAQRPAVDRLLLDLSLRSMRAIYRSYFNLEVSNRENLLLNGPYIIAANHASHLDTGAVLAAVGEALGASEAKRVHVLGARDYFFNTPAKRWFFATFLNVVPIEREEASLAGLRMVKNILSSGEPILIFPEGTRSRSGELQSFKPGLGLLALELNVPIVPAYIEGTFESLPAGKALPRRHRIRVAFGRPVTMDRYRPNGSDTTSDEVYRKIAADIRDVILEMANGLANRPPREPEPRGE